MTGRRPIRTLLFSTLYPSSVRPTHGIFVETRLRELLRSGQVETKVVAPVPWFPFTSPRFGEYALFASTPRHENRNGIEVFHPRYLLPPKVGMNMAPWSLARSAMPQVRKLLAAGFDFDLIDAHYYYPDGVAAAWIGKAIGKPVVVTARGTDLNLIPEHAFPRRLIQQTSRSVAASIGVCAALMDRLAELGAPTGSLNVLRNGVDLNRFCPEDPAEARARLGLPAAGRILLSVGHLVERKGHHVAIDAMVDLPDVRLFIVGEGVERTALAEQIARLGLGDRVTLVGALDNSQLRWWYSAADALVLCSSREGWANVLLESMACGTPVIATDIWGTGEVVATPAAGVLMPERTARALVLAYHALFSRGINRTETRGYAEGFSWDATTAGQIDLFDKVRGAS